MPRAKASTTALKWRRVIIYIPNEERETYDELRAEANRQDRGMSDLALGYIRQGLAKEKEMSNE